MGIYTTCWLDGLCLLQTRDDLEGYISGLFEEQDKRVAGRDDLSSVPPQLVETWSGELASDLDTLVFYVSPVHIVRDRLELMGYTMETSRLAFNVAKEAEARIAERFSAENPWYLAEREREQSWTFDEWLALWRGHLKLEVVPFSIDGLAGWPGIDPLPALRILVEEAAAHAQLVYDATDLVFQETCSADDDVLTWNVVREGNEGGTDGTIVLTEGKSDAWILEGGLRLLYPHLSSAFSFMDFSAFRAEGGAPALVRLVRSFAAAGVANRVIALFDNDAAARDALRVLDSTELPKRFVVQTLPNTELLRSYPTIGPTGPEIMDVNGLAGGIELYLGRDVLEVDGGLSPVQWRGYLATLNCYQGEVLRKTDIKEAFRQKLRAASVAQPGHMEWTELGVVLRQLLSAFHGFDRELILGRIRDYADM